MSTWSVAYKNDNSAYLQLLIMSLIHILPSFLFPEHNSVTIRNILMILDRIIEQVNMECRIQLCLSCFIIMSPDPCFYFIFVQGA